MRRKIIGFIPFMVLALALAARVADPAPVQQARLLTFDAYQRLQPRRYDPKTSPVKVVDIDDASLARFGQWPWPRTLLARLVDRLAAMGASTIAFDIVFAEPDRSSPESVLPLWPNTPEVAALRRSVTKLPSHDRQFADAVGRARVVTGFILVNQKTSLRPAVKGTVAHAGDNPRRFVYSFPGAVTTLAKIEAKAAGNGALNWAPDRDQVVRRVALLFRIGDQLYPSLLAEALRVAQGARTYVVKSSGASGETAFGEHTGLNHIRVGRFIIPTDARGQLIIHFSESVPERTVSAWRVFEPGFDKSEIAGKIVLIGTGAAGLRDIRATPLRPSTTGIEIHAQAIEQIIGGSYLQRPDFADGAELVAMLLVGLAIILILPRIGAAWSSLVGLTAIAAAVGGSWLAYERLGWLVDPVFPSSMVVIVFVSATLIAYLRSEAEREQVRGAFGRYMSPELVERLAADPSRLVLGGEMKELTLLFCDIRGFTAISEQFDAHGLTSFINRFLTPMTDIILRQRGTIDKYMGDCIMAFWNAPLDDDAHAQNACRATLEMVDRLAELNRDWQAMARQEGRKHVQVRVGMGLNTGECCVGNMGSEQRFDYSVLGDVVNLASRLEAQTKTYGVDIVIGGNTRDRAPDFATLEIDLVRVKGKTKPARIYTLLGDKAMRESADFRALEAPHRDMLAAYRGRKWSESRRLARRCRKLADGRLDGLYELYEARSAAFERTPPAKNWDGVYDAETK